MANPLTSQDVDLEQPSDEGDVASTPTQEPQGKQKTSTSKAVSEEDFRRFQATKDREIANLRQGYQQQMNQLQAQLEQVLTRDMSDEDRPKYEIQKRDRLIAQLQQELQNTQVNQARLTALQQVASRFTEHLGVEIPISAIEGAETPDDAWSAALDYAGRELKKAQKQEAKKDKADRNAIDTGGGSRSKLTEIDARIEEAKQQGGAGLAKLLLEL
jgi:hypothetical protein